MKYIYISDPLYFIMSLSMGIIELLKFALNLGQDWLLILLNHLVHHQNTQLNAETKNQASNRHIF